MGASSFTLKPLSSCLLLCLLAFLTLLASFAAAETHYHEFVVEAKPVKRLCRTHNTITVNGQFPGPTLEVRNGDSLAVKVTNRAKYNVTIHWHGLKQLRNPWADGPEYVTQCPIQPGATYTYRFTIQDQEGTLWWHAHSKWLRATVYGALIIYPRLGTPYPFSMPKKEFPLLLGEWWNRNPLDVQRLAQFTGGAPMQEMAPLIQQYQRAEKALRVQGQGGNDPRMEEFRWMLEELRIALFAQELRTPVPMSVKRLQKVWESMQR